MAVRVTCSACDASFSVGDNMRGRRVPCRECKKNILVPKGTSRDDDEEEDAKPQKKVRAKAAEEEDAEEEDEEEAEEEDEEDDAPKGKKLPQKKARAASEDDDDEEEDDDDAPKGKKLPQKKARAKSEDEDDEEEDDEDEPKKKKGMSPMVWVGGGAGVVLVLLAVLFFVMRGGDKKDTQVADNNNPEQNDSKAADKKDPEKKDAADSKKDPMGDDAKKDPDAKKDAEPKKDPDPKKDDPKKEDPKKEDPKKDPDPVEPKKDPDPLPMGSSVLAEKIYQRLLKSTAFILAPQAKPFVFKIPPPNPAVPPPMGSPVGTVWTGKETQGLGNDLKFQFITTDRVLLYDKENLQLGTYQVAETNITLNFPMVSLFYAGTIKDKDNVKDMMMTGTAKSLSDNWTWEITKDLQAPPMPVADIAIKTVFMGSGALVDVKHRLVITNSHVVGDPENLVVHFPVEEKSELQVQKEFYKKSPGFKGKVVQRDDRCDLALVQVESFPTSARPLPMSRAPARPAQNVHSLGNPATSRTLWIYAPGRVRQVFRDNWKITDDLLGKSQPYEGMKIETDAPVNRGDHGGPLVTDLGVLVGVCNGATQDTTGNFIDVSECRALVQKFYQTIGDTWIPEPEPVNEEVVSKIPDLIRKLERDDFSTRLVAATLGGMGSEATFAFQPLLVALRKEENASVRNALEDAVDKIPPRPGDLELLIDVCKDELLSTRLRQQAVRGIIRLGTQAKPATPVLYNLIKSGDLELQRLSLAAIGALGPEFKDIPLLTPSLKSTNLAVVRQTVDTLGKIGSDAKSVVPQLVVLLKKNDKLLKQCVLVALQNIGPLAAKDATPALQEMLKEGDPELGGQVAVTLARIGDTRTAVPFLITKMKSGPVPQRQATIKLLASLGPDAGTATTELLNALDEDPLHEDAKNALVKIGKVATLSISKKMTASMNAKTRLACVQLLGDIRFNDPRIIRALQVVSQVDPIPDNRAAALKTLEKLTGGL